MIDRPFRDLTQSEGLHENCGGLLLAVSGGADSMALLTLYAAASLPFPIAVAHVHHGLRPESDAEEALVRKACADRNIPIRVLRTDVNALRKKGETVEMTARRLRYAFFLETARELSCTHLATAHTLNDQAETVLLHLLHGAGPQGLCGIFPKRTQDGITVIRPLLSCTREQIEAYCEANAVPYATDETNRDETYTRNRIRHSLIPQMLEYNPNLLSALGRTAQALQKQTLAAQAHARAFLAQYPQQIPVRELSAMEEGDVRQILRTKAEQLGVFLTAEQTADAVSLLKKTEGNAEFNRRITFHVGQGALTVFETEREPIAPTKITDRTALLADGRTLTLTPVTVTRENRAQTVPVALPITARTRRTADRIRTAGGTKTLSARMMEKRIPLALRDRLCVLERDGAILWCERLGANESEAPTVGSEGYFVSLSEQ